jgi:plastocyanin
MRRIVLSLVLLIGGVLAASGSASAGGWATVRLDEPVRGVTAGVPFAFGFTVRAHDIHPINLPRVTVFARSQDGEDSRTAEARQEGDEGHYVAELTLPSAGGWKWGVDADAYGELAFETLSVAAKGDPSSVDPTPGERSIGLSAVAFLTQGKCTDRHLETASRLGSIPLARGAGSTAGVTPERLSSRRGEPAPVRVDQGVSTLPLSLEDIVNAPHALLVVGDGVSGRIACGDVGGGRVGDELAFGLAEQDGSGYAGLGVLRPVGERTALSVYVVPVERGFVAPSVEVTIDDAGFSPPTLAVAAGTTVVWRNEGTIAHSLAGTDLAFVDSALLDPGQEFRQSFDAPGRYEYACGPHAYMVGTITVE